MKPLIIIIISSFLFMSSSAHAQTGWSSPTNISDLRIANGAAIYGQATSLESVGFCDSSGADNTSNNFRLDTESPLYSEAYSILLTAQATGRQVQLYVTGRCQGTHFSIINGARLLD